MKKIFFWSPHVSNVATVKNVINSAASLKKYNKDQINVSIIDAVGEWKKYKDEIKVLKINMIEMPGLNLSKFFPIEGFIKSRLVYFLIFFFKYRSLKKLLKMKTRLFYNSFNILFTLISSNFF